MFDNLISIIILSTLYIQTQVKCFIFLSLDKNPKFIKNFIFQFQALNLCNLLFLLIS